MSHECPSLRNIRSQRAPVCECYGLGQQHGVDRSWLASFAIIYTKQYQLQEKLKFLKHKIEEARQESSLNNSMKFYVGIEEGYYILRHVSEF
jgi:hypothetical protein